MIFFRNLTIEKDMEESNIIRVNIYNTICIFDTNFTGKIKGVICKYCVFPVAMRTNKQRQPDFANRATMNCHYVRIVHNHMRVDVSKKSMHVLI